MMNTRVLNSGTGASHTQRRPHTSFRPYPVDIRLPDFLRLLGEVFFRLCEVAFSSAFAYTDISGLFVDVLDPVALVEFVVLFSMSSNLSVSGLNV